MKDSTNEANGNDEKSLPGYFVMVPHEITLAKNISPTDKEVWKIIAGHCVAPNATCFPGEDRIAELLGKDVRTVQRSVKRLIKGRVVVIEGRRPKEKTNIYCPYLPDGRSYAEWRAEVTHVTHTVTYPDAETEA